MRANATSAKQYNAFVDDEVENLLLCKAVGMVNDAEGPHLRTYPLSVVNGQKLRLILDLFRMVSMIPGIWVRGVHQTGINYRQLLSLIPYGP